MSTVLRALTATTALGCSAVGGVFLGFSSIVMPALARLPAAEGIGAMQAVNRTAVRPVFMTALFGTAAGCLALAVAAVRTRHERPAGLLLTGAGLYLLGTVALTLAYHVPRNEALAALDPTGAGAAEHWSDYLRRWTGANHVRAAAALGAAGALVLALRD